MSRSVEEWIGATDDTAIPARVKVRIFEHFGGHCNECGIRIVGRVRPAFDHIVAIINGGGNRESNIQLLCEQPCHAKKTKRDVAEKSVSYRKRVKHLGLKKPGRPMPGSRASGFRKRMDGTVERRS